MCSSDLLGFVARQAGVWLHEIVPSLSSETLCLLSIAVLAGFVYAGKNVSAFWQYVYSIVIFLGITITTVLCFTHFKGELFFKEQKEEALSLVMITPVLLFSFLGFESISSLYAIVKNPRKNVLLGGMIGVACVGALYVAFSSAIIGAVESSCFGNLSLASVLKKALPQYTFLPTLIYFGGLFAILGTLHSMIWSVSVLLLDVLQKGKTSWKKGVSTRRTTILSACVIMLASMTLRNEAIMHMTVLLIATSYVLSIVALFGEKSHRVWNRLVCIFGVLGGGLMVLFSIYSLLI